VGRSKEYRDSGNTGNGLSTIAGEMAKRLYKAEKAVTQRSTRPSKEFIREGNYAAEVPVELIEDETAWSPYLSPDDVRKLDKVILALRCGDVAEAAKYGRVFELKPVAAE
jgi:hypothetical protein